MKEYICDKCYRMMSSTNEKDGEECDWCKGEIKDYNSYLNSLKDGITELICEGKVGLEDVTNLYLRYADRKRREDFTMFDDKQYRLYVTKKVFEEISDRIDYYEHTNNYKLFSNDAE